MMFKLATAITTQFRCSFASSREQKLFRIIFVTNFQQIIWTFNVCTYIIRHLGSKPCFHFATLPKYIAYVFMLCQHKLDKVGTFKGILNNLRGISGEMRRDWKLFLISHLNKDSPYFSQLFFWMFGGFFYNAICFYDDRS